MSPYELAAAMMVFPIVACAVWLHDHFATDGPTVPDFEAWCRRERPVLFAVKTSAGRAAEIAEWLRRMIGERRRVEHSRGRFPWTTYVFVVSIEVTDDGSVVCLVVDEAIIRRTKSRQPDLTVLVPELVHAASSELEAVWMHSELRDGDPTRGDARRGRGWVATRDHGILSEFQSAATLPAWVTAGSN